MNSSTQIRSREDGPSTKRINKMQVENKFNGVSLSPAPQVKAVSQENKHRGIDTPRERSSEITMGLLFVECYPLNVACMFHKTFDQLISRQSVHTVDSFKKRGPGALKQGRQNLNRGWNVRRYSANQQWGGGK